MSENKAKPAWHGIPREEIPWYPTVDPDSCIGCQLCYVTCGRGGYSKCMTVSRIRWTL